MKYNQNLKYNNQFISYYGDVVDNSFEYIDYSNNSSVEYFTLNSPESDSEISLAGVSSNLEGEIQLNYSV